MLLYGYFSRSKIRFQIIKSKILTVNQRILRIDEWCEFVFFHHLSKREYSSNILANDVQISQKTLDKRFHFQ